MSRYGENKGEFGSEGYKCYYKAQAPPGGKSSNIFGTDEPVAAKPAPVPAQQGDQNQAQNTTNTVAPEPAQQTDPNFHKKMAQKNQSSSIFGDMTSQSNEQKNTAVRQQQPIKPSPQLDMKTNDYPKENVNNNAADPVTGKKISTRVAQPPGGHSTPLW